MEKKLIELLKAKNVESVYIRELGLCFGFDDDVIENVEIDTEEGSPDVILFHTEYGDTGTFDMLAKYQQEAIIEYIKDYVPENDEDY